MPQTQCCVPLCKNRGGHRFPKLLESKKKWIVAIKRLQAVNNEQLWQPTSTSVICHQHFLPSDYISVTSDGLPVLRKCLRSEAVPSKFSWSIKARAPRKIPHSQQDTATNVPPVGREEEITTTPIESPQVQDECEPDTIDAATQTAPLSADLPGVCIERFKTNAQAIHFYTGLESYEKFQFVLATLGPAANELQYRYKSRPKLSIEDQFFMAIIKLRQYRPDLELALLFNTYEENVANIIITWWNFMYFQWREISLWPSKELVNFYMPEDFGQKFPSTRIILDGMEFPIKKPKDPAAQKATWSSYKNKNTLKLVVGTSPGGLTTHIPDCYGGSASDRALIERSDLTSKCDPYDSIMADKGFKAQDMFAPMNITINQPTFLKRGNQFSAQERARDKKISSKRVHVERVIGLAKTYKILKNELTRPEMGLGSIICFNCFMLCNFRTCIVPKTA